MGEGGGDLRVTLVQGDTRWHDPPGNRAYYGDLVAPLGGSTDLVILPETFTSGFSNEAVAHAETMRGATGEWMLEQAAALDAAVTGSVQIRVEEGVYNRLLWAQPDGTLRHYDKRHLFRYADEHHFYAPGRERLVVEWRGWRVCPLVCYDLRFPVFSRNRYQVGGGVAGENGEAGAPPGTRDPEAGALDYDLLIYVANWPAPRADVWSTLLRARAMENLACVAGVNRVGVDGNGISYAGGSVLLDFVGRPVATAPQGEAVVTGVLSAPGLEAHRRDFPAMLDADRFRLE